MKKPQKPTANKKHTNYKNEKDLHFAQGILLGRWSV